MDTCGRRWRDHFLPHQICFIFPAHPSLHFAVRSENYIRLMDLEKDVTVKIRVLIII
jgi:hypothetical protein